MADTQSYLVITSASPRFGWDRDVGLTPNLQIRTNTPLTLSQVQNDQNLNDYVILVRMADDLPVPVTYRSWSAIDRMLTFAPSGALTPGATYQITIRKELQNTSGRSMISDRIWTFQVSDAPLGQVSLRAPGDATAYSRTPQLVWNGVWIPSGSVTYEVQLNTTWQFVPNLTWSTEITVATSGGVQTATIGVPLAAQTAYYWRARARTLALTGEWSETWSFWVGTDTQPSPDTVESYRPAADFSLSELLPDTGSTNLSVWPTLRATFTRPLSGQTLSDATVQLWQVPVDGRARINPVQVSGATLVVAGHSVDLVPPSPIAANTRYTLRVKRGIGSTSGDTWENASVESYFTGLYRPLYGGNIAVRADMGGFIEDVTDDEINFQLWRASLELHEVLMTRVHRLRRTLGIEDLMNYQPATETWGMLRYAETGAAVSLLESYYYDQAKMAGRHTQLATFSAELSVEILKELRARIQDLRKEREATAATFLYDLTVPRPGGKGTRWIPNGPFDRDDSYRSRPGSRGAPSWYERYNPNRDR